jgi:hypothetical protein
MIDDIHTLHGARNVIFFQNRPRDELDVEAFEGFGSAPGLENAHLLTVLEEPSNENIAQTTTPTSYER